jgi:hypothetical protein
VNCKLCGNPIRAGDRLYREETGWTEQRHGGGTHALRLRKLTGHLAHWICVERAVKGLTGQTGMFDN